MRFTLISILFVLFAPEVRADDRCNEILRNGIKDTLQTSYSLNEARGIRNIVCKKNTSGSSSDFEFELFDIFGVGDNRQSQRREEFCSDQSNSVSLEQRKNILKQTLNRNAIDAWESCISSRGLFCTTTSLDGAHFRFLIEWDPSVVAPSPEILSGKIINASCEGTPLTPQTARGTVIEQNRSIGGTCTRNSSEFAVIDLNTTQGFVSCYVPGVYADVEPVEKNSDGLEAFKVCSNEGFERCSLAARAYFDGHRSKCTKKHGVSVVGVHGPCWTHHYRVVHIFDRLTRYAGNCANDAQKTYSVSSLITVHAPGVVPHKINVDCTSEGKNLPNHILGYEKEFEKYIK